MARQPSKTNQPKRTSPWPFFIAIGLVLSELGILFGLLSLSVGGILLLGGSCAGALVESAYATSTRGPLLAIGGLFVLLGVSIWSWGAIPLRTPAAFVRAPATDGIAFRGAAILVAGGILVTFGVLEPQSLWWRHR